MRKAAPLVAFCCSIFLIAFVGGALVAYFEVFPYSQIRDAVRTLGALRDATFGKNYFGEYIGPAEFAAAEAPGLRWSILDKTVPRLPVMAFGGLNQYLDVCPDQGCLAVVYDAEGKVRESWPYRPDEIYTDDITKGAFPHEMFNFHPRTNVYPVGIERYADGDILVNFQSQGSIFPFGMGIARVGPDGAPRWTRFDYSHHWSTLTADGIALVPNLRVGDRNLKLTLGTEPFVKRHKLECETGRPQLDTIEFIDSNGVVIDQFNMIPILLDSNWAGILMESPNACDPIHVNYIDQVGADAGAGLNSDDLVVSLRNVSRFAVLDRKTKKIKRVVSGDFLQQHSVHYLSGSKFLIFDNRGGDASGPASRIVELDLVTGTERRLFPNADTPKAYARLFSDRAGFLDISPDRSRVLASFSQTGRAFEIDIATGRLLAVFDNVHDISSRREVPKDERNRAGRFVIYGMSYVSQ